MKLKLLALAALGAVSLGANAYTTTVDFGVQTGLELASFYDQLPDPINDEITFSLASEMTYSETTVANNLKPQDGIDDGMIALYAVGEPAAIYTFGFDGESGDSTHSFDLMAGDYYFVVTGKTTGTTGAFYTFSSDVSPVPEPETYAMLLAGLGIVGSLYRRRKNS